MEFGVLGPLEVTAEGRSLGLAGTRARAVLALLLVHANQVVSCDRLINELWPGQPRGADSLQVRLSELRKALRSAGEADRLVEGPARLVVADDLPPGRWRGAGSRRVVVGAPGDHSGTEPEPQSAYDWTRTSIPSINSR